MLTSESSLVRFSSDQESGDMKKTIFNLISVSLATCSLLITTSCSSFSGANSGSEKWRSVESAEAGGGIEQLISAAQEEGEFNTMGLYDDWANYGELLQKFSDKYHIKINNDVSSGSSQDLINTVKNRKGQEKSLDYLDTGTSFAQDAADEGLLSAYVPVNAAEIQGDKKASDNTWHNHLGGNMAIGCDASAVKECPKDWKDLLKPEYKGKIAISGDPTSGEAGFMTVLAAALGNGGALDNIQPGIDFFKEMKQKGNFLPVAASAGTIETRETPVVIQWDYLLVPIQKDLKKSGVDLKIHLPQQTVSSYYAASINKDAPHPAVARLWLEFLFSDEGQNLLLKGAVKPVRLQAMINKGTVDKTALNDLPKDSLKDHPQPSLEQRKSQHTVLANNWSKAVG